MAIEDLSPLTFGVIVSGDMSGPLDNCLRIAGEVRAAHEAGFRVGLRHVCSPDDVESPVAAEVQRLVMEGWASIIPDGRCIETALLICHPPVTGAAWEGVLERIGAARIVIVPDRVRGLIDSVAAIRASTGRTGPAAVTVAPISSTLRDMLLEVPTASLEADNWKPNVTGRPDVSSRQPRSTISVGMVIADLGRSSRDVLHLMAEEGAGVQAFVWIDRGAKVDASRVPAPVKVFDGSETSFEWFLRRIDVLLLPALRSEDELPEAIIATALGEGKLVLALAAGERQLPPGVMDATADTLFETAHRLLEDEGQRMPLAEAARSDYSREPFLRRLVELTGRPTATTAVLRSRPSRVLLIPKGGVGIGHVARLLAIARRFPEDVEPVFVSLSDAFGVIEEMGFRTEYIPSMVDAGAQPAEWEPWLQYELEQLIEAYQARAIVFDGSDPGDAISRAVASKGWCRSVWVRRGMWAPGYDPSLDRARDFDLIIEPGEIAAVRDRGATARRRHEAVQVDPITLLEPDELLPRDAAAKAIGLDPSRPAALIQLGSGGNRDILAILDQVLRACRAFPDLQLAVAEWANAQDSLGHWPDVTILKGAPLQRYYRAFDLTVSAAGYNAFHEIIASGLPAIFIPNRAAGMDDQSARAGYAQEHGAAIELGEEELDETAGILELLMKPQMRAVLGENCMKLARSNGAAVASRCIADLVT